MISKETIRDIATQVFLSGIIDFIPMKAKVKRKTIEGMIQKNLPQREQVHLDISQYLNFDSNNEIISWFIDTLEQKFSHCDLTSFYKNIQTLKIIEKRKTIFEKLDEILGVKSSGSYLPSKNKIRIYSNKAYDPSDVESTKTHELIHFATTRKEGNMTLCGFERTSNGINFATGLNEGYTEWLNLRYFLKKFGGVYSELQTIVSAIESLVGAEKMQQYFFSNDLDGLITDMEKYATREQALALIEKMDHIYNSKGKPGGKLICEKISRQARVDVANMLVKKSQELFEKGGIPESNYKNVLFNIELFTHNYITIFYADNEDINRAVISDYIYHDAISEMTYHRYLELRDQYYEEKKDNQVFTYELWRDKNGLTIAETIDAISKEKRQGELNEMFREQSSKSTQKNSTLKQW